MVSRLPRWIPPLTILLCLLVPFALAAPRVMGRPSPGVAKSGILVLRNTNWDSVRVEIRLGPSSQCAGYPSQGVKSLKRGEAWAVAVDDIVCWRREESPGAGSLTWTPWQTRQMPSTGVDNVAL